MLDHSGDDAAGDHGLAEPDLIRYQELPHRIVRAIESFEHIVDCAPLKCLQRRQCRGGAEAFTRHERPPALRGRSGMSPTGSEIPQERGLLHPRR